MTMPLLWMREVLRDAGLKVKGVKGWRTRGRPYSFEPRGVMFHHTASNLLGGAAPALGICISGRPGISGPLCNILVGRDNTVNLVAAGYANHGGEGGPILSVPKDSANRYFIGVEVENDGLNEPWRRELLDTVDTLFAALLMEIGATPQWLIGHKEWAPGRKIDPARLSMPEVRARVRRKIKEIDG
jgi:hypothetical protein